MSTVDNALSLLDLFSENRPRLGLSEIARLVDRDKSTVQRYVRDLVRRGVLEQDGNDKTYYLGPALTRLALVRERTHPMSTEVARVLRELVDQSDETAHASQLVDDALICTGIVESNIRGTRVYVDPAESLPLHATASGIAFLSATPQIEIDRLLADRLDRYTPETTTSKKKIQALIESARDQGYCVVQGSFESDVVGMAAPVLGFDKTAVGAIAIATPAARFGTAAEKHNRGLLLTAAARLSTLYGAKP